MPTHPPRAPHAPRAAVAALALLLPGALHAQPAAQPGAQPGAAPGAQPAARPAGGARPGGAPGAPGGPGARAAAPQAVGQLVGTVVAAGNGQPLGAVTVTVRAPGDTALVAGALTRADGTFRIDGLRPGRYTVRVRALGFAALVRGDVAVTAAAPRADLGRLALAAVATQLSGVQVQGERQEATLAPDRNSYAVKDMPATTGGTAVDVLRNVPAVEVDGDNRISLRGNGGVVVQINGRVSPMRGEQLGNYLAQLPANIVAKVEVVSNPSAKNDPEGLAGIINIVLKEQTDLGTSGGFNTGGGSTGQLTANGNLGHQQGRWTLFGSYGFMHDRRTVDGFSTRRPMAGAALAAFDADVGGTMIPESHSVTTTAEYKVNGQHTLANNLVVNQRAFARDFGSFYRDLDAAGALARRSTQRTDQAQEELNVDYALTWRRIVDAQKNALTTEVRFNHVRGDNDINLTNEALSVDGLPLAPRPMRETNAMDERNDTWFLQTDWTRALGGDLKLETGAKGTYRRMTSDFAVANALPSAEALAPDLGRSNAFVYDEHVSAVYGVLSRRTGKVNVQGGLRYEVADTRFDLRTTRERFDNDYRSLFPSALVSYDLDAQRQVKLSYSKRINRPVVQQLNPFGFREDQYNIFAGNPGLRPEYTHALELGWQQSVGKGSLQLTPFFRHTTDAVRQIGTVGSDSILRVGFRNAATSDQYGADANLSLRAGAFSGFGGASVFEQVTDASNLAGAGGAIATAGRVRAFGWSARGNVTWKVTPRLDLQSFAMYRAGMRTEQGRISHFTLANVALRQKLRGDRATMTLRVMDPFGTMGWAVRASDGRVLQAMERQFGARGAFLNFGYTFGRPPKIRQRPQEQDQPAGGQPGIPG